jgi:regulator of protease activity HflC (stomatin/prohibitin superfamily)
MEFLIALLPLLCIFGIPILVFIVMGVRVVQEYERGVIFRLGRVLGRPKGPGLFLLIPFVDRMKIVDLRTITLDVPSQEAISKDNVTVRVNAVVYFNVVNPNDAIIRVEDYQRATSQMAQTSLRNVIGQSSLDQLLSDRESINNQLRLIIDEATEPWGVKVTIVEIKDVELNTQMIRAMAREAEAERERRAKVIHAEGEMQASEMLADAARAISREPGAMTLRYLQTLVEIGVEQNTTTIFPIPVELFSVMMRTNEPKVMPHAEITEKPTP